MILCLQESARDLLPGGILFDGLLETVPLVAPEPPKECWFEENTAVSQIVRFAVVDAAYECVMFEAIQAAFEGLGMDPESFTQLAVLQGFLGAGESEEDRLCVGVAEDIPHQLSRDFSHKL